MSEITLVGKAYTPNCQDICTGGCNTGACQDCTLGEHSVSATDFWNWVNAFTPPQAAAPVTMSFSDVQAALATTTCDAGIVLTTFDPDKKFNVGNLTVYIGPNTAYQPDAQQIPLSIVLFYAITATYANVAFFNFYIGYDEHGNYIVLFNLTDSSGQAMYYADMSGLIP